MAEFEGRASIDIDAPAEKVFELVSDPTRYGEWSPENTGAEWIDGATGPAVGASFKGSNKQGIMRWSTKPVVKEYEPPRVFSFATPQTIWTYRVEPKGDGSTVTESASSRPGTRRASLAERRAAAP